MEFFIIYALVGFILLTIQLFVYYRWLEPTNKMDEGYAEPSIVMISVFWVILLPICIVIFAGVLFMEGMKKLANIGK